ncbi:MAG: hypothetical protein DMD81_09200 [Candidatus Rokuibacteriota bacterium]|nr:MAG: hypothetical protein DMD81_09200 [Candidatus Rokubacteria bacterium]
MLPALTLAWAIGLTVVFLIGRGADAGRLPELIRAFASDLARSPVASVPTLGADLAAVIVGALVVAAWYGIGDTLLQGLRRFVGDDRDDESPALRSARACAFGAGTMSLVWFALGLVDLYRGTVAVLMLIPGLALALRSWLTVARRVRPRRDGGLDGTTVVASAVIAGAMLAAFVSTLAPPTGKDALIYHRAVPKAFVTAGGLADVPGNIASFFALGAEMNGLWGDLLGRLVSRRAGEAAFGVVLFAWFPLLLLALYGWARERGLPSPWALLPSTVVATVPTVFYVAGNACVDLALAVYATLAIDAAGRWWRTLSPAALMELGLALGFALAVKHVAALFIVPIPLLILLAARRIERSGGVVRLVAHGLVMLCGAGLMGSVWYVRTWILTGNPLFPFAVGLFGGHAAGWDERRSALLSMLLSVYGGETKSLVDYLGAPLWISFLAQPEDAARYEGVLGFTFLFCLPFLLFALWRRRLDPETTVAATAAGILFAFWLASSQNLRYLLPTLPALALVSVAAVAVVTARWPRPSGARSMILGTAVVAVTVTAAWFLDAAPLRAALGGEPRAAYLDRRLEYFPYYRLVNETLPPGARVWLIDMRRDTYHLERPYVADYLFEDWTIRQWVEDARRPADVRDRALGAGITHVLVRHDLLLDPSRSPIVDDRRPAEVNTQKMGILRSFLLDGTDVLRGDRLFLLVKLDGRTPPPRL